MRKNVILGGLALVLGIVGWSVVENETILADGQIVRLALAPVDPRSLMQGDYMALNYEVQNQLRGKQPHQDGYLVVAPDALGIARFVRSQEETAPLTGGEIALRYRVREGAGRFGMGGRGIKLATNAFFFQEGSGKGFEGAKYGEFRVSRSGEPRLVALLDADLKRLGENRY